MKLHVAPPSPRAFKVLALANHLGLDYELCPVDLRGGANLRPEFVALNPNKKMPVLEEDDGFVLWESNAILQYLADKRPDSGLLPSDPRRRAEVNRWQFWEMGHWDPACGTILFERLVKRVFGLGDADPAEVAKGEENFHRYADVLDGQLRGRAFVTGDALTVADFSLGAWLNLSEVARFPLRQYREITRWHAGLMELPAWKRSIVLPPIPAGDGGPD
jgi:glutathione S-transferase